ncbi:hypothetical protein M758_4G180600 [Ceratodon purpureus]|nr:hypothetical protein M758_4G180600 [Ceratodon purpureus]
MRFLIVPFNSVASFSTFCACLISAGVTATIKAGNSSFSRSNSPMRTTFSPRMIYRPKGRSQYSSPTIDLSTAPSNTTFAVFPKISTRSITSLK